MGGKKQMIENRQLTDHYTLYQLTHTNHVDLLEQNRHITDEQISKLTTLGLLMEVASSILDVPLVVTSGYRCPELNSLVGSSIRSQHLFCEAADSIPKGMSVDEAFRKLRAAAKIGRIRFGQLIYEKAGREGSTEWLHLSLGTPYREKERCGQILTMNDGNYTMIETVKQEA